MQFIVYILECADGSYYTGSTNNLSRRLHQHNHLKSGAHYTKIRRPVKLIYTQNFDSCSLARAKEAELKRLSRIQKQRLVSSFAQSSV